MLGKITNEELLQFVVASQVELGRRADNFADAIFDAGEGVGYELMNEALAFTMRADQLIPTLGAPEPVRDAWHLVHDAERDINAELLRVGSGAPGRAEEVD